MDGTGTIAPLRTGIQALEAEKEVVLKQIDVAKVEFDRASATARTMEQRRSDKARTLRALRERLEGIEFTLTELRASLPRDCVDYAPRPARED